MSAVVRDGGNVDGRSTRSLHSELSEEETVRVSVDLVAAARRNVGFLRFVKESPWLLERPVIVEAVRRYDELWMPLISDLSVGPKPPMVLPPIDIEWVWYCHALNPVIYREYCQSRFSKLIGKSAIFDEENEEYALTRCRDIWVQRYPSEPFENESASDDSSCPVTNEDLFGQVLRLMNLSANLIEPYMSETLYLIAAKQRYKRFLYMIQRFADGCARLVPASDILLMWVSHQSYPTGYAADVKEMGGEMGKVVAAWEAAKENEVEETKKLWERVLDQPYEKAGGVANGGAPKAKPQVYWEVSDIDVNTKYKSLSPRFLLEVGWNFGSFLST